MMKIFVSYRTHDLDGAVQSIKDRLADKLCPEVFLDSDAIKLGANIKATIDAALRETALLLLLVGKHWAVHPGGLRIMPIQQEDDWVRFEILTAQEHGVPAVVVYVGDVTPLHEEEIKALPEAIQTVMRSNYSTIKPRSFRQDLEALIDRLAQEYQIARRTDPAPTAAVIPPDAEWKRAYLTQLETRLGRVDAALPPGIGRAVPLMNVYTQLHLLQAHRSSSAPVSWDSLLRYERVALTGDAGSGKSTLLFYLALRLIERALGPVEDRKRGAGSGERPPVSGIVEATFPVFISLAKPVQGDRTEVLDSMEAPVDQTAAWLALIASHLGLSESQIEGLLRQGGVLLLVDGLDEVYDPADREQLIDGLARIQQAYNSPRALNRVIVSCRQAAWQGNGKFAWFEQVALQPMSPATAEHYLEAWCRAIWGEAAQEVLRRLRNTLQRSPGLAKVAQNPQMAAMLAHLDHEDELPYQRALLYKVFIDRLMRTKKEDYYKCLLALALKMQSAQQSSSERLNALSWQEAAALLEPAGADRDRAAGQELLKELIIHTGLLEVDEPRGLSNHNSYVRFKHRTFQEFLAACHFTKEEADISSLPEHASDPAWAEVLAFASGLLAEYRPHVLPGFLEQVLRDPGSDAAPEEVERWAPRLAAASVCLTELVSYKVEEATLAPVRSAEKQAVRLIQESEGRVPLPTRLQIAEGFGAFYDPRLQDELRWVWISGGTFLRGSIAEDAWPHEAPSAKVTLGDYWIQRWPVTVAEFQRFLEAPDGYRIDEWWDEEGVCWRNNQKRPGPLDWEQNSSVKNRPVSGVCWWEARAYCRWYTTVVPRSRSVGIPEAYQVLLPSEAQWEFAVHPEPSSDYTRTAVYPWGTQWKKAICANFSLSGLPTEGPTPVGLFPHGHSCRFGLWDAAGNVAEHCLDGFAPYDDREAIDPVCEDYRHGAAVRGGHFRSSGLDLRITARFGIPRGVQTDTSGFRCVGVRSIG